LPGPMPWAVRAKIRTQKNEEKRGGKGPGYNPKTHPYGIRRGGGASRIPIVNTAAGLG